MGNVFVATVVISTRPRPSLLTGCLWRKWCNWCTSVCFVNANSRSIRVVQPCYSVTPGRSMVFAVTATDWWLKLTPSWSGEVDPFQNWYSFYFSRLGEFLHTVWGLAQNPTVILSRLSNWLCQDATEAFLAVGHSQDQLMESRLIESPSKWIRIVCKFRSIFLEKIHAIWIWCQCQQWAK